MKSLGFGSGTLCSCVAAAMLAGCGGSQPGIGAAGPQSFQAVTHLATSAMKPGGILYAGILNSSPSQVREYQYPFGRFFGRITDGIALGNCCSHECNSGIAIDHSGELFVADYGDNTVTGYATPNYFGKKPGTLLTVISSGITSPCGIVIDGENNLFVTLGNGGDFVNEYAPPYKHVLRQFTEGCGISWTAVNSQGNFFMQTCSAIYEFIRPNWRHRVISEGLDDPNAFAFDAQDNLWVSNEGNSTVTEYACCAYGGPPVLTLDVNFDLLNQVFVYKGYVCVVNGGSSVIVCEVPPDYSSTWTITSGLHYPGLGIVDDQGDPIVSNCCVDGHIAEYKWPWATGSNGGNLYRTLPGDAWPMAYLPETSKMRAQP
jgi:hypothetical protein